MIDKADGVVFRCTPDGSETERWLEIPAWMFDRASCARDQTLTVRPFFGRDALMALSALLDRSIQTALPLTMGGCDDQFAATGLLVARGKRALPQQVQLVLVQAALQAEQ